MLFRVANETADLVFPARNLATVSIDQNAQKRRWKPATITTITTTTITTTRKRLEEMKYEVRVNKSPREIYRQIFHSELTRARRLKPTRLIASTESFNSASPRFFGSFGQGTNFYGTQLYCSRISASFWIGMKYSNSSKQILFQGKPASSSPLSYSPSPPPLCPPISPNKSVRNLTS